MKKIISILLIMCTALPTLQAQDCELPIAVAFKTTFQPVPNSTQRMIGNKLRQLLSANGVSGSLEFHSFALVPEFEVMGKSVTPGPPKQVVYQLILSLKVMNVDDGVVFSSYSTDMDGVGTSEAAAYNDAVKRLSPKNQDMKHFIYEAQDRIIDYYNKNLERTLAKVGMLKQTRKYDEALYLLMRIPECTNGYESVLKMMEEVWLARVNLEGMKLLTKAQAIWGARTDSEAAIEAANLLAQIDPESNSYAAAGELMREIKAKAEKNTPWDIGLKVYEDNVSLEKQRIDAAKEVAVTYAKHQQANNPTFMFVR